MLKGMVIKLVIVIIIIVFKIVLVIFFVFWLVVGGNLVNKFKFRWVNFLIKI